MLPFCISALDRRLTENRPVEIHRINLKPADFFARNPAIDVPSSKNLASLQHAPSPPTSPTQTLTQRIRKCCRLLP